MYRPRRRTICTASLKRSTPETTFAEVLAKAVSRDHVRCDAMRRQHTGRGHTHSEDCRLRMFGEHELVVRPFETQRAQPRGPGDARGKSGVRFVEDSTRFRKRLRQRFTHSNFLRSLARKDEGNHRGLDVDTAAICCSTRWRKSLVANRDVVAIAFRTAFADDRPWPTNVSPETPSNGAAPYSE